MQPFRTCMSAVLSFKSLCLVVLIDKVEITKMSRFECNRSLPVHALSVGPPVGGTVWKGVEPLGGGTSLGEVSHWRTGLMSCSLASFFLSSLHFLVC